MDMTILSNHDILYMVSGNEASLYGGTPLDPSSAQVII